MEHDSQHIRWYDIYKTLTIAEGVVRSLHDGVTHGQEICNLLQSAQYLAESRTVIVQDGQIDASLVSEEDTVDLNELDDILFHDDG